jgi:hypothetical protein
MQIAYSLPNTRSSNQTKPPMLMKANLDGMAQDFKNGCSLATRNCRKPSVSPSRFTHCVMAVMFLIAAVSLSAAAQASIVVFRNSTEIVAGSDSKPGFVNGGGGPECKVDRLGDLFWSVSGLKADYSQIVAAAREGDVSIRHTAEKFSMLAPQALQQELMQLRASSPSGYQMFMKQGNGRTEFIFFGMEKETPAVAWVAFVAGEDANGQIRVSVSKVHAHDDLACPQHAPACGFAAGSNKAIRDYMVKNYWGGDLVEDVGRFVQLEIDAVPAQVGPPIRILKIDGDGPLWVQNGEGCDLGDIPKIDLDSRVKKGISRF